MHEGAPIPTLDLSGLGRPCGPWPRSVLELVAEGPLPADATSHAIAPADDDDDARRATLGPVPLRRAADAWRLAIERGLIDDVPGRCFPDHQIRFFCDACDGMGQTGYNYDDLCGACGGRGKEVVHGWVARPTSLASMWIAAWPAIAAEAESLARTALARLDPPVSVERVQWGRLRRGLPHGGIPLVQWSPIALRASPRVPQPDTGAIERAAWWPGARALGPWTQGMLRHDVAIARAHRAAGVASGPLEPVLRLWELGIVVEELHEGRVVLDRACRRSPVRVWQAHVPVSEVIP